MPHQQESSDVQTPDHRTTSTELGPDGSVPVGLTGGLRRLVRDTDAQAASVIDLTALSRLSLRGDPDEFLDLPAEHTADVLAGAARLAVTGFEHVDTSVEVLVRQPRRTHLVTGLTGLPGRRLAVHVVLRGGDADPATARTAAVALRERLLGRAPAEPAEPDARAEGPTSGAPAGSASASGEVGPTTSASASGKADPTTSASASGEVGPTASAGTSGDGGPSGGDRGGDWFAPVPAAGRGLPRRRPQVMWPVGEAPVTALAAPPPDRAPTEPARPLTDVSILRRVLEGLRRLDTPAPAADRAPGADRVPAADRVSGERAPAERAPAGRAPAGRVPAGRLPG